MGLIAATLWLYRQDIGEHAGVSSVVWRGAAVWRAVDAAALAGGVSVPALCWTQSRLPTPDYRAALCSTPWVRTTSEPRGPRGCPSGGWCTATPCAPPSPPS